RLRPGRRAVTVLAVLALTGVGFAGTAAATVHNPPTNTAPVTVTRSPDPTPLLLNTRVANHRDFERVVLDLSGPAPGYTVRYVPELTYDPSGQPVPLRGGAYLQITLTPTAAHTSDTGLNVYCCARLFHPNLADVRGVAL